MPRFCANITMMFNEVTFLARFARAARAGFTGVEFMFPYAYPAAQLAELAQQHDLEVVLHNLPPGDWAAGERGIAALPDRVNEFQATVGQAIEYASALGCTRLNCLAGVPPANVRAEVAQQTFVDNLRFAAAAAKAAGVRLLSEPINNRDMPGFFLNNSAQALALFDEAGADNLWLQYDIYHMQIMEGDIARTIERALPRIAHMQFADNPGRHEPGTGEINYPFLFEHVDRLGYDGWMGAEYRPLGTTESSLGWME